ncbi:MAG: hypothetical protein MZV70_17235 [Desulfobacterales bacterium]|nr:hypothetical protein [Desulfobacterales bacterium]
MLTCETAAADLLERLKRDQRHVVGPLSPTRSSSSRFLTGSRRTEFLARKCQEHSGAKVHAARSVPGDRTARRDEIGRASGFSAAKRDLGSKAAGGAYAGR